MCDEQKVSKYQFLLEKDTLEGLELIPTYLKISQILLLQHDEFFNLINKFNQTLESFTDDESDLIQFSIVPNSNTTMLWKLFIRIQCSRVSRINQVVLNKIFLSLNQFLSVYQSLSQQLLILDNSRTRKYYFSLLTSDIDECCICMDRQSNLVLSCTHKFCDECLKKWSTQTCPICRGNINLNNGFILVDIPETDSVKKAIMESILGLPNDTKNH